MESAWIRTRLCLLLAVLGWTALLLQLRLSVMDTLAGGGTVAAALLAYFGYFTILTNIFVALMATAGTRVGRAPAGRILAPFYRPHAAGCATTSILVVGLVYHLLLRANWRPWSAHWVADSLLHYVVPTLSVLHWLAYRPPPGTRAPPSTWAPLAWCAYPLAYLLYVLLRGPLAGGYPYFFLDVTAIGYARMLLNATGIAVLFTLLGFAVLGLARLVRRRAG